ncbi:unnamed protein product, partial [Onchocerca ochengi]|uniref:GLOBIN domain-containing protein n=1 Tax=Onchocerca ochengi TaxID=42157 RepID=A0A182ESM9_ONCOC
MSHSETKAKCLKVMNESGRVGNDDAAKQDGLNFYKYMFGHHPDLRVYFKGAENFTPTDVQNSDRFAKQGNSTISNNFELFDNLLNYGINTNVKFWERFGSNASGKIQNCDFSGQRILLAVRILINTYDDSETFKAYARETVNRHIKFKMDRTLWAKFFTLFVNNLKEHTTVDEETEKAFQQIGKEFSDEC